MRAFIKKYPVLLLLPTLLLAGCMSPERDMARFLVPGPDEEPAYREKAMEFIRYAQAGDVEHMLAITSSITHATQTDSIRSLYADQVVPAFKGKAVTWKAGNTPDFDESNNVGLLFTGTARGQKSFSFDVVVMKEGGKLVIINIRVHH